MEECNCGKIPPCYGSLEFAIYEEAKKTNDEWKKSRVRHGKIIDKLRGKLVEGGFLDDTHDKVYELNKQMCDLEIVRERWDKIGKEWDSKKKEIVESIFGNITNEKSNIMEEKKIKKMTKAEAFEYLSNKKINAFYNEREVQLKLFSLGVVWCTLDSKPTLGVGYLFINEECHMTHCGGDWDYYKTHRYEEVSADDILSIEIVEEKNDDERKGEILDEIAKLGEKISDLIEEYDGDIIIEINQYEVLLRNSGDILYRK